MKNLITLLFTLMLLTTTAISQVAINSNGNTANTSAMLDISSTSKGLLIPSMTSSQRGDIATPANGLLVYDIDTKSFWYYNSTETEWQKVGNNVAGATNIDGLNDGKTGGSSYFIGTGAGYSDDGSGNNNTAMGKSALHDNISGDYNTAIGAHALANNTAMKNTAVGYFSLYSNSDGEGNVAIGDHVSSYNSTGDFNVCIGNSANQSNQEGSRNTIIGYSAGSGISNHNKSGNIFIGYQAGYLETGSNKLIIENSSSSSPLIGGDFAADEVYINGTIKITGGSPGTDKVLTSDANGNATWETPTTYALAINDLSDGMYDGTSIFLGTDAGIADDGANYNTGIGKETLKANTSGQRNSAVGYKALDVNTDGESNSAFGMNSMGANIGGNNNTAFGYHALISNTTGSNNTAIGHTSGTNSTGLSNTTAVGYNTRVSASNRVHIGNTSVTWIGGQVIWDTYSDARAKNNVKEDVVGLDFIKELRPVTYYFDKDKMDELVGVKDESDYKGKYDIETIKQSGFLAQEVDKAAIKSGYDFSGITKPTDEKGYYSLGYAEFVVPLVKAMQEQQLMIDEQNNTIEMLIKRLEILENSK